MATSNGRDVKFAGQEPNALEQQDGIKQPFAEAHRDYVNLRLEESYAAQGGRQSDMVREDSLSHDMRPAPEIAADQDRETFDGRWENERVNARLEAAYDAQADRDKGELDRSRDDLSL